LDGLQWQPVASRLPDRVLGRDWTRYIAILWALDTWACNPDLVCKILEEVVEKKIEGSMKFTVMTKRLTHLSGTWPTPRVFETTRWGLAVRWGVERTWKIEKVGEGRYRAKLDDGATQRELAVAEDGEDFDDPSFEITYTVGKNRYKTLRRCKGAKPVIYRNDPMVRGYVRVYE
jgi:hypothetical protein